MIYIHDIKLSGDDEFTTRFNHVTELLNKYYETGSDEDWQIFVTTKIALEQGFPIPTNSSINEMTDALKKRLGIQK